jgi:hypothetical protein
MQVRSPNIEDWEKLCHLMEYLRGDRDRPLILGADNEGMLMWYVDALFAVHPNMRGHTSGGMTMGRGFTISVSTKQKLNTKSSTESELVGVDDMMPIILWTHYFLLSQGYGVLENLLLQDNKSSNKAYQHLLLFHLGSSEYEGVYNQMVPYKTDGCWLYDKANSRQSFQASKGLHYGESL